MERTQRGYIIVLTEEYTLELFDTEIRISHLTSGDQINRKPRLICNSRKEMDNTNP